MTNRLFCVAAIVLALSACSAPVPRDGVRGHLNTDSAPVRSSNDIPPPVNNTLSLPKPRPATKAETYSVVVNNVPAHDLLFALARDAKLNVDIHPDIKGTVTLNAIDQTLPQLLSRIAKQIDMRFELDGNNLAVMPDSPFLRHYKVDYVNLVRNVSGTVSTDTQIATGTGGSGGSGVSGSGGSGNVSSTRIQNTSKNQFWESLEKNIKDILRETDKEKIIARRTSQQQEQATASANVASKGEGTGAVASGNNVLAAAVKGGSNVQAQSGNQQSSQTDRDFKDYMTEFAANVIVNPESGIVTVRATGRQHEKIQEFLDRVINAARRQVMIEATIVEVVLSDGYEQGIDWSKLIGGAGKFALSMSALNTAGSAANLTYKDGTIDTAVRLLQTFGNTKVLSSPRLSVLNNQTALLKVVENVVYFNVKSEVAPATVGKDPLVAYTTTPQTVSVGLMMTVTPQISDNDMVILNVRPTIASISAMIDDPNPDLKTVKNKVPQLRTREIESIMRVQNGEIAVLGGLMEDGIDYKNNRVPILGQIPLVGEAFTNRNNSARKSELVIFLRPVVIKDASLAGDFSNLRPLLPGSDFFASQPRAEPFNNLAPDR